MCLGGVLMYLHINFDVFGYFLCVYLSILSLYVCFVTDCQRGRLLGSKDLELNI